MSAAPGHPSEIKEWIRLSPGKEEGEEGKVRTWRGEGRKTGGEETGGDEQPGKEAGQRNRIY